MKISTQAKLISTALVAAAIAAPIAHGQSDGSLIYQASQKAAASSPSGYVPLKTGEGFSFKAPSYWRALGVGGLVAVRRRHGVAQLDV
jgi:uncharacterized membrane protein